MTKWATKSGRFDKEEINKVDKYLQREEASKNELVRKSVFDIIAKDINVDKYLQNKEKNFSEVVSGRFTEDDLSKVDIYLQTHKMSMNDLIRGSVLYYVDNPISLEKKKVDIYLQREMPGMADIISVLTEIAENSPSSTVRNAIRPKAWREMFSESNNIEMLGSLFWKRIPEIPGVHVPSLTEFEKSVSEEYPGLYVDSIDAVGIPELRSSIKLKLGIDSDVFDGLLTKLVESGKYKMGEGSGEGGLRLRGRNYMFLKERR